MGTSHVKTIGLLLIAVVGFSTATNSAAAVVTIPAELFYVTGSGQDVYTPQNPERYAARQQTQRAVADWVLAKSIATLGGTYTLRWINGIEQPGYDVAYIYNYRLVRPDGTIYQTDQAFSESLAISVCPTGFLKNSNGACEQSGSVPDPEVERGPDDCNARGNPCNPGSGNKYQIEEDHTSADGSFTLTRTYNSLANTYDNATTNSYSINRDSGLGVGWTYKPQLEVNNYYGTTTPAYIRARRADGRAHTFSVDQAGVWITNASNTDRLIQDGTGYTLSKNDGNVERYNLRGQILNVADRSGKSTQYSYNASGVLVGITGPFGHTFSFTYSGNHIATLSDPAGRITTYSYDGNNNLTQVTYPDNTAKLYHYENTSYPSSLTGISFVDSAGIATRYATYAYDSLGLVISTEHAGGQERFSFAYDLRKWQTTVTNAVGEQELLSFTTNSGARGLVKQQNLVDNKVITQSFDARSNLLSRQDETGRTTTYTYNASNQRLSLTEGAGTPQARTRTYTYISSAIDLPTLIQSPSVAPGLQKTTAISYDANYNPTVITESGFTPSGLPVSRSVTLGYNANSQVVSINGPRTDIADITTISYYPCTTGGACGQLKSTTNALGQTTHYDTYTADGRVQQTTDPNGLITLYTYDPRGRVTNITQTPVGKSARIMGFTYTAAGDMAQATLADGNVLTYGYDAARNLRTVTDRQGNRVGYNYDLKGNRTEDLTMDPAGTVVRQVSTIYDLRNHVSSVNAAGSLTKTVYDAVGNLVTETDPNNAASTTPVSTTRSYDALNRLFQTMDELAGSTLYSYDPNDRLAQVTAPNGTVTSYTHDDLGNRLVETSRDRGITSYQYDAAGNVISATDARGVVVNYTYDALNRLTTIRYPAAANENVSFTYDTGAGCTAGIGRLCGVQDESGATTFAYDAFGNVLTQVHTERGVTYSTRYTYDAGNRVTSAITPDGRMISYTRDSVGHIASVTTTVNGVSIPLANTMTYRADGLLAGQTLGNGLAEARQYDLKGQLTYFSVGSADTRLYNYDANGNLKSKQTLPQNAAYDYDLLDRLKRDANATTTLFGYDGNGNRILKNSVAYTYPVNTNQLTKIGNTVLTLDPAGNTTAYGTWRYTYNNAGRLIAALNGTSLKGSYFYNHQGLRTAKTVGSTTTLYHYDTQGHLLTETTTTGALKTAYIWADDRPIAQIRKGTTEALIYLHTDNLNTPRLATNPNRIAVWNWEGNAFGDTAPNQDPDKDTKLTVVNLRLPGQYFDSETGLFYNWNRYYDPRIGRYVTSDPIGLAGGLNTYAYVGNNPPRFVDPRGLARTSVDTAIEKAIVRGDIGELQAILETTAITEQRVAIQQGIRSIEIIQRTSNSPSRVAEIIGRSTKDVKQAIEKCKQQGLPSNGPLRNPDVRIDPRTGEMFPELPNGRIGDSIGNIFDHLK